MNSVDVVTDESGNVIERLNYDAWGKRRASNWRALLTVTAKSTTRGFTGHEHLDKLGLIHMKGRVYDPHVGRFLSADPFIQAPANTQNLNRYSYALNNPLVYTDPSGYAFKDWFEENWRPIVAVTVAIAVTSATAGMASGLSPAMIGFISGAAGGAALGVTNTALHGGSLSQTLTAGVSGAVIGGVSGGFSFAIGSTGWAYEARALLHGAKGGFFSIAAGGKFEHGLVSGIFTAAFSPAVGLIQTEKLGGAYRTAVSAVLGGTASELGGGKFANGAITGAFQRMYNDEMHKEPMNTSENDQLTEIVTPDGERIPLPKELGITANARINVRGNKITGYYVDIDDPRGNLSGSFRVVVISSIANGIVKTYIRRKFAVGAMTTFGIGVAAGGAAAGVIALLWPRTLASERHIWTTLPNGTRVHYGITK